MTYIACIKNGLIRLITPNYSSLLDCENDLGDQYDNYRDITYEYSNPEIKSMIDAVMAQQNPD